MRLFFAIKPDEKTVIKMEKFRGPLMSCNTPVKWVSSDLLHITLIFMEEIAQTSYHQVIESLDRTPLNIPPFNVKIKGSGSFNHNGIPGVFWFGTDTTDALRELYRQLLAIIPPHLIPPERKAFRPHITIGRNKKQFSNSEFYKILSDIKTIEISSFKVEKIYLTESQLTKDGPTYTDRREILLT